VKRLKAIGVWVWHHTIWWVWHGIFWWFAWRLVLLLLCRVLRRLLTKLHLLPWDRRLRSFLRSRNVVNLIAIGALVVSIGAAATVIGIAEVQIKSTKGGSGDLWHNPWYCTGLTAGLVGLAFLVLALSSNWSQSKARRKFPDLEIEINTMSRRLPPGTDLAGLAAPGAIVPIKDEQWDLLVTNREPSRNASLTFTLFRELVQPDGDTNELPFLPPRADRRPWNIPPTTSDLRIVNFERGIV
jgi:hypothetical protein